MQRPRSFLLKTWLLLSLSSLAAPMAAAQTSVEASPSTAGSDDNLDQPLQFSAVHRFVQAIGIAEAAESTIDRFWQPAITALIAGNPDKAAEARAFAEQQRMAELSVYAPLVAFMIDSRAVELLYPAVAADLEALQEELSREYGRDRTLPQARIETFARRALRIRSRYQSRVNPELEAMARLAETRDGLALREINRQGLFWCVGRRIRPAHGELCRRLEQSDALRRLRRTVQGEKLVLLSAVAHGELAAMVAMGHDPGISLHLLLPPERVRAAGLNVPPNMTFEQLVAGHRTAVRAR